MLDSIDWEGSLVLSSTYWRKRIAWLVSKFLAVSLQRFPRLERCLLGFHSVAAPDAHAGEQG